MVYYAEYQSPVGRLLLTGENGALTGLWMEREAPADGVPSDGEPVLVQAKNWLDGYFRGDCPKIGFSLAPKGTAFQKLVWEILLAIPYGKTRSYGDISREVAVRLGKEKMSAQAVGQAVGKNPISILIPCHRVVGSQGQLTGYAGGLERKVWLLKHESMIEN